MRAFTLLEILIALSILGVTLTVLFSLLTQSFSLYERTLDNYEDFLILDDKVKRNVREGLESSRVHLREYGITLEVLRRGEVEFLRIE